MLIQRISLEVKVFVLLFVAVVIVIATGYLSYISLSHIVSSVNKEARPDLVLLAFKDINYDLDKAENNIRLYNVGGMGEYYESYNDIVGSINNKMATLYTLAEAKHIGKNDIDSIYSLISERVLIWDEMIKLSDDKRSSNTISLLSAKLVQSDTIISDKKANLFQRIFKRNKNKSETDLNLEKLRKELAGLEKKETIRAERLRIKEQFLINKNEKLSAKLNLYISKIEENQNRSLAKKVNEADYLANKTYEWLLLFCISVVLLLIMVLFVIFNYVKNTKAYQKALLDAKDQAQQLSKAKELFIANVSHELRSPMNAIIGMSEQLLNQDHNSNVKEQLSVVNKSASHLYGIVNDILDFSKMQAGKFLFEKVHFNIREFCNEIYLQHKILADKKNLDFNLVIDEFVPDFLIGDPLRLRQIVINLLDNALKFTHKGEVSLMVSFVFGTKQMHGLKFTIEDTGIGIAEELLPCIFDEFTQAGQNISRDYGGTGLGLAIVNQLVGLQDGEINVESELGKGTRFNVTIPIQLGKEIEMIELPKDNSIDPKQLENLTVLIVDDEDYNRALLRVILEKYNIHYKEASNGFEAVNEFMACHYDVILMDIRMPLMDGVETSGKILKIDQERSGGVSIIAISANSSSLEKEKCLRAGIKTVLVKPFKEEDLLNVFYKIKCKEKRVTNAKKAKFSKNKYPDFSELERLANGDLDFMYSMLEMYIANSLEGFDAIKKGIELADYEQIANAAHKMVSPNRHLKAETIVLNLKRLETDAREKKSMAGIVEITNKTERELSKFIDMVKNEMENGLGEKVSV